MATITPTIIDGFGHGVPLTEVSGPYQAILGSPQIVGEGEPLHGNSIASLQVSSAGMWVGYDTSGSSGLSGSIWATTFYVYFADAFPANNVVLCQFDANAIQYDFGFVTGTNKFYIDTTGSQTVGHSVLSVNTWYRVTLELDVSANPHVMRASVDNGTQWQDTRTAIATSINSIALGRVSGISSSVQSFSSWVISVTNGDYETMRDWTSHDVETLRPTSDGTHNISGNAKFWDDNDLNLVVGTTDAWTRLDTFPMQVGNSTANDWIRQQSDDIGAPLSFYMEVLLGNLTGSGVVEGVRTYLEYDEISSTGISNSQVKLLLSDDTEVLTTGSISVKESTEDPGTTNAMYKRLAIPPSGGWDSTKVNGLKMRFGFSDASPSPYFIDMGVEVLLSPAAAGGADGFMSIIVAGA